MTCTGRGTAFAGQYANMGTSMGKTPSGQAVTATDPSHYSGFEPPGELMIAKQSRGGDGTFFFTSDSDQIGNFALATSDGVASQMFSGLAPGFYSVSESQIGGWQLVDASCDNGDSPDEIMLGAGERVTCTFGNRLSAAGIPTLSAPALALLAILVTLMAGWARRRGRR
jgi:hypothetical protein